MRAARRSRRIPTLPPPTKTLNGCLQPGDRLRPRPVKRRGVKKRAGVGNRLEPVNFWPPRAHRTTGRTYARRGRGGRKFREVAAHPLMKACWGILGEGANENFAKWPPAHHLMKKIRWALSCRPLHGGPDPAQLRQVGRYRPRRARGFAPGTLRPRQAYGPVRNSRRYGSNTSVLFACIMSWGMKRQGNNLGSTQEWRNREDGSRMLLSPTHKPQQNLSRRNKWTVMCNDTTRFGRFLDIIRCHAACWGDIDPVRCITRSCCAHHAPRRACSEAHNPQVATVNGN